MDLQLVWIAFNVLAGIASAGAWWYALRNKQSEAQRKAQRDEIDELDKELGEERNRRRLDFDDLRQRLSNADATLRTVPTIEAVHELAISLEHLGGDIKVAFERLGGMERVVERLEVIANRQEEFLLNMKQG